VTPQPPRHLRGVLDTSTVIMLSRMTDPATLPAEPLITTVTLAELTVGPLVAATDAERAARQAHVQQAEADFDPLPFDAAAARAFGRVAASLRQAGRKPAARAYDAMIAATAISRDLPVYTCNPADFASIDGLTVVSVPVPPPASPLAGPAPDRSS
jgi:tRNA(fMet)-specific endonuclease VapC